MERVDGELTVRIPLDAGGEDLVECARGIGRIEGNYLVVIIEQWLADKLRIAEGNLVVIDNRDGKFNITRRVSNDPPDGG